MTLYKWSKTANSNATIDSTINWAENQSPGSVNNSARAEMAAVAKYRDDTSGMLETAGSSDDYTLTTNQVFSSLIDGMSVVFTASFTNTGAATLNVDTLGAKALVMWPGDDLLPGKIVEGGIYAATYNAADEEFRLHSSYPETVIIPAGTAMLFAQASAPTGWTKDTTHNDKALRVVSGTPSSGGSTAFSTVFASRTPAGTVGDTTLTLSQIPSHNHSTIAGADGGSQEYDGVSNIHAARVGRGGSENQRYNIASTSTTPTEGRTSNSGSGASHTHSFTGDAMGFDVQYVDVMIAIRN